MNKDAEGNEYTFRTPKDWGIVTGVLVPTKDGSVALKKIDPESGDLKFTMHDLSEVPDNHQEASLNDKPIFRKPKKG